MILLQVNRRLYNESRTFMKSSAVMAQKEKPKIRESTAHRITDRAGFDESIILNSRDRTCHSRCIAKFRRIDLEFKGVWKVYFPARWEPQEYLPHESHLAQVEHILGLIQDAETSNGSSRGSEHGLKIREGKRRAALASKLILINLLPPNPP